MPRKGTPRKPGVQPRYAAVEDLDPISPVGHRLTRGQVKFIELVAAGTDRTEAAKQAGLKNRSSQYRTLTNPLAIQYLKSIRAEARAIAAYDAASAMEDATEAAEFAKANKNPMALVKAFELKAKLSGLLIDRVEIATVDLTGALAKAQARVSSMIAPIQLAQAAEQATSTTT